MAYGTTSSSRRALGTLACALGLTLFGCSGGSGNVTAPSEDPEDPPAQDPPPAHPPDQDQGIVGVYSLAMVNNSQPGQVVTVSNPDGRVIGLYRFDPASELQLDALQTYTLRLRFKDDKGEYGLPDEGEFKWIGRPDGTLDLTFNSATYGDSFTAVAGNGVVSIKYDFDGDGQLDTVFSFRRVGG